MNAFNVVILAGYSCAGKSTLTAAIEEKYGFSPMHQQPIYKDLATEKGYERTREWLAAVGNDVFITETAVETARRIRELEDPKGVIIDASYGELMHKALLDNLSNARLVIVSVQAEPERRTIRMMGRMNAARTEAETERLFRDGFLKEVGLDAVMQQADFTVTNTKGLDDAMKQIAEGFSRLGIQ